MDRQETISRIRKALKKRSGKPWSVTGGRGTAYGWLTIDAPPARRKWLQVKTGQTDLQGHDVYRWEHTPDAEYGHISPDERAELAKLLGLEAPVHDQGVSIPASNDYWQEYIDRAEGREPAKCGEIYWD